MSRPNRSAGGPQPSVAAASPLPNALFGVNVHPALAAPVQGARPRVFSPAPPHDAFELAGTLGPIGLPRTTTPAPAPSSGGGWRSILEPLTRHRYSPFGPWLAAYRNRVGL